MAGPLSGHLINSYESSMSNQSIYTDGLISFSPSMHGGFNPNMHSTQQSLASDSLSHASTSMGESIYDRVSRLQAKLNQKLGPEFISTRPGPGGGPKLTYAEGWKVINVANEVFGYHGWSSNIVSLTTDYMDFNEETKRYNVGVSAIMRVTLKEGVHHEDVGYGMIENVKSRGQALDKCKKEAVTDGLKRTLRTFGNVLGNCLYDKSYTSEIVKIKPPPVKFDQSELHRLPQYSEKPSPSVATSAATSASTSSRPIVTTSTPVRIPPPAPPQPPKLQPQQQPVKPISSVPRHMQPSGLQTPITTPGGERKVTFAQPVKAEPGQPQMKPLQGQMLPPPLPAVDDAGDESFGFSDDDALFACVDLGDGDLGRPIDFEEGTASSSTHSPDEEAPVKETPRQSVPQPQVQSSKPAGSHGPMGLGRTNQGSGPQQNAPPRQGTSATVASTSVIPRSGGSNKPPSGGPSRSNGGGAAGSAARALAIAAHTRNTTPASSSTTNQNQNPAATSDGTAPPPPQKRPVTPSAGSFNFPQGMPASYLQDPNKPPPMPQGLKRGADAMMSSSTRSGTSAGMGLSGSGGHGGAARRPLATLAHDGRNAPPGEYQQEEPMQGCHIVDLADAAEDWSLLLEVLYNPFRQQTKCSFRMLAAMLRLGRKYDFREAYEDALSRIRFEFPSDFEAFDNLDANMTRIEYQRGIYCDLLNLAYECGVHSSIPLLAFCCLREETLETILTGVEREDNSCAVLSDDLKMPMALAFGRMALFQHQNLSWLRDDGVVPHSSCQSPTRCAQRRNTMAGVVDHDHQGQFNLGYTIDQWDDRWTGILCAPCEEAAATTYEPEALHATKRKRTEDTSEPAMANTTPITRSKIWVPYGDMVLQAESTQFRVNRDVLARQSPVFSDMFSLPQPSDEPTIEGCPVVHLFDSAKDWELLLEILYDPFKYEDALPFDLIASMLRLGRKYEMKTVKQNAVSRIRYEYPTRLDSWERVEASVTKIILLEGDRSGPLSLNVFKLAYECDVLPSLPILAFLCINNLDIEALLQDEIQDSDGSCIVLPDDLKLKLAIASERAYKFQRQHSEWLADGEMIPDPACKVPTKCTSQRQSIHHILAFGDVDMNARFHTITFWQSEWSDGFCRACGKAAKEAYRSKLPAAWAALPSFFGMPEWQDFEGLD
ncbi:hypothetical protein R3P38DRAFT_3389100 [Favolaschia claudopus]|uniref:BTB domain-containing protein n=1 Tax=Favolaschia claudopus TaxID=2862362 RepID=A0AAW0D0F1_9AGAR